MAAMFTQNIQKMVAHAANAYFEEEDIEMILKVKDISQWSARMRAPMEAIYGVDYFPQLWNEWSDAILKVTAIRVVEFSNGAGLEYFCSKLICR